MALASFVAGHYTATWDADQGGAGSAAALGLTREGWTLGINYAAQAIQGTDKFGDSYLDGVYRGIQSMRLTAEHLEYTNAALAIVTMYNDSVLTADPTGTEFIGLSKVGRLLSDMGGTLVLTDVTGTPAEDKPATLTAAVCIVTPNQELQMAFTSGLRTLPLPLQILPYLDSSVAKYVVVS